MENQIKTRYRYPKRKLSNLKPGEVFRYIGSDPDDWHTVDYFTNSHVCYYSLISGKRDRNYITDKITVIIRKKIIMKGGAE